MWVIAVRALKDFWLRHPDAESSLRAWHDEAKRAQWKAPKDIKDRYASVSFIGNNRVIFNIKGNDCRLIVAVAWHFQAAYVKFIGTHAGYDRVDAATVEKP